MAAPRARPAAPHGGRRIDYGLARTRVKYAARHGKGNGTHRPSTTSAARPDVIGGPVRASERRQTRHEIHVRRDPPQPLQGPQARAAEVKSRLQPSRLSTAIIASEARGASRHLTIEGARASKRSVRLRGVATGGQGTKSRVPISEGPSESLPFVCPFTEDLAFIFSEFRTQS